MVNSFAISQRDNGVRLIMGGTGIVAMATGVDTLWVQNNFVSLGGNQTVTGRKLFTQPLSFSGALAVSGAPFKLVSTLNYSEGQTILNYNPTNADGGPDFQIYDFAAWNGQCVDFWHRKAYDSWGALSFDWDNLILSGYYDTDYWTVGIGLKVNKGMTISGKTPIVSEWNNIDAGERCLHDSNNNYMIDWENGFTYGWIGMNKSMSFKSGYLFDYAQRISLDWMGRYLSGNWTATEWTVTTGRLGLQTGNYGFTKSGVVLAAGFRSAVSLLTGASGTRYEIGSGNYINRSVILVSGNGIVSRLPDITLATYTSGGAAYTFKMTTAGTSIISGFNTAQTIDGQPQVGLSGLYKYIQVQPYGGSWFIIGQN